MRKEKGNDFNVSAKIVVENGKITGKLPEKIIYGPSKIN